MAHQRALKGKEQALGMDHLSTLDTVDNMAVTFRCKGRYEEAFEWFHRALWKREDLHGSGHLSTWATVNNIADIFDKQFLHDKALDWYNRSLMDYEKAFGKDHPETLRIVHIMVGVFYDLGRDEEARNSEQRTQAQADVSIGKTHPSTLDTAIIEHNTADPNPHGYVVLNSMKYNKVKLIGSGMSSILWLIENESNKEMLVCKEVVALGGDRQKFLTYFNQECSLLKNSDHPNIVRFVSFQPPDEIDSTGRVYMEYCEGGDLKNLLSLSRQEPIYLSLN
ncbi:Serine/threonine-protein kinase Nek2 [Rhizina undulata]